MADRAHKLIVDMRWDETSGVDHPANEEEGWIVMKSADRKDIQDLEDLIKAEEAFAKQFDSLTSALQDTDFSGAPKEVQDAVTLLLGWLQEYGYGYGYGGDQPSTPGAGYPQPKAKGDYPKPRTKAMEALWNWFRERLQGKHQEEEVAKAEEKALVELWPAFCQDVANIWHSPESAEDRVIKMRERVATLKGDIETQITPQS